MVSAVVIGALFLAGTALVIALSWKRFLRRLHRMAAAATTGSHTPARYSRSPQNFHRFTFNSCVYTSLVPTHLLSIRMDKEGGGVLPVVECEKGEREPVRNNTKQGIE